MDAVGVPRFRIPFRRPQTSSELLEKMNNPLCGTISVSNLSNQLKQLVGKELIVKENRRGGRYSLAEKKSYS